MESIKTATYQIHFDAKAFEMLNDHLKQHDYSSIFVLVDENTRRDCLPIFIASLPAKVSFELLEIQSGEAHKNITACVHLWEALSKKGADRKSLLINLGGGVLTDLGGFVASTFKRGISFVNIPTTLLAMVDASIGGKTGVDLGPLKNQVGVINQPEMVLIGTQFLKTLPEREVQSGFAEMLKHGLIQNKAYWEELKALDTLDSIATHIGESVRIKNEVVLQDPRENHLRKILNYGHTLGHAVESYFLEAQDRTPLLHGEAIAVGMVLEAYLSNRLCGLEEKEMEEIKRTFLKRYPRVSFNASEIKEILDLLRYDKKNTHGRINFVLLNRIGKPEIDVSVPEDLFEAAFAYYSE